MEVKRFLSSSMQEALKAVREEFGPDAVILSNSKVEGGVEIVAALDYEEDAASASLEDQLKDQGQPSPSQIARMHADNHLRLQKELNNARQRIETARSRKAKEEPFEERERIVSNLSSDGAGSLKRGVERIQPNIKVLDQEAVGLDHGSSSGQNTLAEISAMKGQLEELKTLIREQGAESVERAVSVPPVPQHTVKTQIEKKLDALSLSASVQDVLLSSVSDLSDYETEWKRVLQKMSYLISADQEELIDRGGRYALVGPTGSGKTMSIGKLAARYVMKYGAEGLALVTTDRYRIAAHEQLRVFGRILNVPVHAVDDDNTLDTVLKKLKSKRLVLIDTAGLTHVDACWSEQLQEIKMAQESVDCYLTVSSVGQYQVMCSTYQHYNMVGLKGAVITKVDEAVSLGEVISFLIDSKLSASYFTDGQRVPEDIHRFDKSNVVERAQSLLNTSERWVSLSGTEFGPVLGEGANLNGIKDNLLFSHSA